MANNQSLGIGPSGLRSAEEHLSDTAESESDEQQSAKTEKEAVEEETVEEETAEEGAPEEDNVEGFTAGEEQSEGVPDRDEVAGRGGQTVVTTHNGKNEEVEIQCGATACVFNRQHNCMADKVHISFNPNKGMRSAATQCDTFQMGDASENSENS